jgi:hypothetical protein
VNIAYEPPRHDGALILGLRGFRHDNEKIEVTVSASFATGMRTKKVNAFCPQTLMETLGNGICLCGQVLVVGFHG